MKYKPLISIIIPIWNTGTILSETIDSIKESAPFEIILVDDGSTDKPTLRTIDKYKHYPNLKIIHQPNSGTTAARITGVNASIGDYLLFLDSDDLIEKNFCTKMLHIFRNNPEISYVYPDTILFGDEIGYWNSIEFDPQLLKYYAYFVITSLIKKADYLKIGGFNKDFSIMDDREFWIRSLDNHLIGKKCHVFHFYRKLKTSKLAIINSQKKIHFYENMIHQKYPKLYQLTDYLNPKILFYNTYFRLYYFVPQFLKTFFLHRHLKNLFSSYPDLVSRLPPPILDSFQKQLSAKFNSQRRQLNFFKPTKRQHQA
jgi:glycosyltransferase involved in cell wall biosynthesis